MNEEPKTQHCGDTCGAVAAMAVAFRDYVPPEQRMATAISQVLSGEMSQRGAAEANGVAQQTLSDRIKKVTGSGHSSETQASTEVSCANATNADRGKPKVWGSKERNAALLNETRAVCRTNGIKAVAGKQIGRIGSRKVLCDALLSAGVTVPPHLLPNSLTDDTETQTQASVPPAAVTTNFAPPASYALDPTESIPTPGLSASFDFDQPGATAGELDERQYRKAIAESQDPEWCAAAESLWKFKCLVRLKYNEPSEHCTWNWADWNWFVGEAKTALSLICQRAEEASAERFGGGCHSGSR